METDSYIQNSLRKNFQCTLLTIAHRLNTICDYDRVLVLSFGLVQEFDTPANLLRDPNSALSAMVNETGETNAALLRNIAFKAEKGIKINVDEALGLGEVAVTGDEPAETALAHLPYREIAEASQVRWHDVEAEEGGEQM